MAGYIGTKAVNLSTTAANVGGDADIGGALDVGGAFTSQGIDDNATSAAMTLDASGHAIIPAGVTLGTSAGTYAAANTLDDYEEGTWTPSYPSGWTAETQYANYTKVGRFCHYNAKILVNSTSSGTFYVGNLPFTNGIYGKTHGGQMFEQVTLSTNRTQVVGFTSANSNIHTFYQLHIAGSAWSSLTSSNVNTNSEFYIQGVIVTA